MAASSSSSSSSSSSNRGNNTISHAHSSYGYRHNQHPQLRLPLSHHGLPRAPTSPSSSFSSRSNRYEALGNNGHSHSPSTSTAYVHQANPQHNPSTASTSSAVYVFTATTTMTDASHHDRAASFFHHAPRAGDAPPSPPMTPFSPSAFPSEASTPIVLSPALQSSPLQTSAPDDSGRSSQCCAHCRHCRRSGAAFVVTESQPQQRSRSVEHAPSPVSRQASTRSLKFGVRAAASSSSSGARELAAKASTEQLATRTKQQKGKERSSSREGSRVTDTERGSGCNVGKEGASGEEGGDCRLSANKATTTAAAAVKVDVPQQQRQESPIAASNKASSHAVAASPPPYPSSSFSRMGKRIKAALGPKKNNASASVAGPAAAMGAVAAKKRSRDARLEVEEVGGVHWTEM